MEPQFIVPQRIAPEDMLNPTRTVHGPSDRFLTQAIAAGFITYSDAADFAERRCVATGSGGKTIYAYNFTASPICMVDSNNAIMIIEPIPYAANRDLASIQGSIIIEVVYNNQSQNLSKPCEAYLRHRKAALEGLEFGTVVDQMMNDDLVHTFVEKASMNLRQRFTITEPDNTFQKYGGAFYVEDLDVVIGSTSNLNRIWIHPRSNPDVLKKARPRSTEVNSLGMEIYINDLRHAYDKAFVNISGKVVEVPVIRDPSMPEGYSIWYNVHEPNSKPQRYPIDGVDCPIKFYTNVTDAQAAGNPERLIEQKILEEKAKLNQSKVDYERDEFERNRRKVEDELKRRQEQLEEEKRRQEQEAQRRKENEKRQEQLEKVSFWRKMLLEGTKAVAAAATTAALMFGWYMKQKKG